jgi:hypothetical protein
MCVYRIVVFENFVQSWNSHELSEISALLFLLYKDIVESMRRQESMLGPALLAWALDN